jgi:hypothetical protein
MSAKTKKSCGECNACCSDLEIDTPEFKKPGGTPCAHLTTKGCGIYTTRFPICRQFLCGWLLFPELDKDWRPDRSGVIILQVAQASIPPLYQPAGHGVQLLVTGGEAAITRPGFAEYVSELVRRKVAVYMTATTSRSLVNEDLEALVAAGDLAGTVRTLTHLYRLLTAARDKKGFFSMVTQFYRMHVEKQRLLAKNRNK